MRLCHGCILVTMLSVVGCDTDSTPAPRPPLEKAHHQVAERSDALALRAYASLRRQPGNLVFSPYGISLSLSMLLAGADGATRDELLTVLGATAKQETQLHANQGEMQRWLTGDGAGGEQLEIAGAIFVQRDTGVLKSFAKTQETQYEAPINVVDFADQPATARKVINDWAAEKTHGKIDTIISPADISPQMRLVLTNAVYFKGAWEHAFERAETEKQPFHIEAGETVDCNLMHVREKFGYVHRDGVRVLVMPYRGNELSMAVILPDERDGLTAVEERLDDQTLKEWLLAAQMQDGEVPVWLPRFKFESGHDLKSTLEQLGVKTAFDPAEADLSRVDGVRSTSATVARLYVDQVWQQAMIEVNEEGTEAAAVTTTETITTTKEPGDSPRFRADHPFLFLIRENQTGLILFMGRVVDPAT